MNTSKSFFVTGATGNQGSATAHNLAENGCNVIALVRNQNSPKAEKLRHPNIQIKTGNLDDPVSYKHHLENVDGAFAVFTYTQGVKKEIAQGISFVNTAKEMNVPFILYASVIGADAGTGIPHWESKNVIEKHLQNSGIPYTIIRPAFFFQNFLIPDVQKRIRKGSLVMPFRKDKTIQFVNTEDVGKVCASILMNNTSFTGRTFSLAADEMELQDAARIFSEVLGKPVKYAQLPGLLTRIFMGKDLHTMFSYMNKHNVSFVENMQELKIEYPFLKSLKEWIQLNRNLFVS